MSYTMHKANILDWARDYDGPLFHALLCDPPYHLTEIVKRFGKPDAAPAKGGVYNRTARGFMGKTWDGGDIAYQPDTWAALAAHLYPGAFGMAFAGSRGWHRMAVAIEDAGLIIHPTIFGWGYGSGFPKATRIDVQLDRQAGAERRVVGQRKHAPKFDAAGHGYREKDNGYNSRERQSFDVTAPATELAADWQGYRYGLQALKPAIEPIIVFQRPYAGRPVQSIAATGAGALWIDGGRIGNGDDRESGGTSGTASTTVFDGGWGSGSARPEGGRWPANLVLIHSPRCDADGCADDCPARRLGEQSGEIEAKRSLRGGVNMGSFGGIVLGEWKTRDSSQPRGHDDTGTAARYFYQADWALDAADPLYYCAKASRAEREAGLDPRTVAFMRLLDDSDEGDELEDLDDTSTRYHHRTRQCRVCGTRANDGHGSTACGHGDWEWVKQRAFDQVTVDDGRQAPIDNPYLRGETKRRNPHPTVKPLSLTRYLATLLLPPERYAPRRLLVPFAGVASEVIGGMLAGWDVVTGVELDEDDTHIPVANARISYWLQRRAELRDPSKPITVKAAPKTPAGQIDMFESEAA